MSNFKELEEFESRFETMDAPELRRWRDYWTQHAQHLQPKVKQIAMKRVHRIDKAIQQRLSERDDL